MTPHAEIHECADSHARLNLILKDLTEERVRGHSKLPGWTVGHLLTHLARNADSVVRRLEAAKLGEIVDQYVGRSEGRAKEIEEGASRPPAEILEDVRATSDAVDAVFASIEPEVWDRVVRAGGEQKEVPASELPYLRWREVEIHLVDLGLDYTAEDWPEALVQRMLPGVLDGLPDRANHQQLLGWALGRHTPPILAPWS